MTQQGPDARAPADAIPTRPLGRADAKVSILGVGGHHLGEFKEVEDAIRLVHEAVDAGVTFFDNCWEYVRRVTA
jgi:aryl-alcohol dehydrogenase-like predicted oxidoreductase